MDDGKKDIVDELEDACLFSRTDRELERLCGNARTQIVSLRKELDSLRNPGTCDWAQIDEGEDRWQTGCNEYMLFDGDTPTEGKYRFCCFCGKRLVETQIEEITDDLEEGRRMDAKNDVPEAMLTPNMAEMCERPLMTTEYEDRSILRYFDRTEYKNRELQLHRIGAPAVIYNDGREEYWVDGIKTSRHIQKILGSS